jgi:integrase
VIIRPRINAQGDVTSWTLDYGVVDGVRKRERFAEESEAKRALALALAARRNLGLMGLQATTQDMAEFLTLRARLPAGRSLSEAVEFFLQKGLAVTRPVKVPELVTAFIWSRKELKRGKRTIETYEHVLGGLSVAFPLRLAHKLTRDEVRAWLRSKGWSGGTQNKALGHVRGLFRWAMAERHAAACPCEGLEDVTVDREEIEDLTLRECEMLLNYALKVPRYMVFLCLGLFRGMRRSELERLRFEEMDWQSGTVIAAAKKVKTRARRVVEIPEIARAWILAAGWTPEMMRQGKVAPANHKTLWPRFWRGAGLGRWPHNGLRHTFASMHYAMHEDETALRSILGQSSEDVLHSNYRALKTRRAAEEFWALRPPVVWVAKPWTLRDAVFGNVA